MKSKVKSNRTLNDYVIPNYELHQTNLDATTGRGVAIYTHSSIQHNVIKLEINHDFNESCLLQIKLCNNDTLLFGCFYRSPTTNAYSEDNNNNLNQLIKTLCSGKRYSHFCFVGDFNFKNINWKFGTTPRGEGSKEGKFIETIRDCFLYQNITEPTRCHGTDEPSTIDLLFSNEEMQISNIEYHAPLGKSDHSVLTFNYDCYLDNASTSKKYMYNKADYTAIKNHLMQQNWKDSFNVASGNESVESLWQLFKMKMLEIRNKFVETNKIGTPPWKKQGSIPINKELQNAIRQKSRLHRQWISNINNPDRDNRRRAFAKMRNKVKSQMRKTKRRFEKHIVDRSQYCPKIFWGYTRSKLKTKAGISPLLQDCKNKNSTKFSDKEKADVLQHQFTSVFTQEPDGELPEFPTRTVNDIHTFAITSEMVTKKINSLDVNKAGGPDEIHPRLLKELANEVSDPLAIIFNKSLSNGIVPTDWRNAHVSPIYKKGARNVAANYRPISLTSIICKIMESLVKDTILSHLTKENLFSKQQHGFIPGRSTTTQLLSYLNKCVEATAKGDVIDAIYFDFAKAFDTVPHRRLIKKLRAYGINGKILNWIAAFLQDRKQTVKVNGTESEPTSVISGIPKEVF